MTKNEVGKGKAIAVIAVIQEEGKEAVSKSARHRSADSAAIIGALERHLECLKEQARENADC